jgi:hypothetical protein
MADSSHEESYEKQQQKGIRKATHPYEMPHYTPPVQILYV